MTIPENSYQQALYDAQDWAGLHRRSRRYRDIRDARARVVEICTSDWYLDRYASLGRGVPPVERIRSKVWGGVSGESGIGLGVLDDATIIHELAHWVTPDEDGHGPAFARELLALVREFMGFMAYGALKTGLERVGYWG